VTFHCSSVVGQLSAVLSALEAGNIDEAKEAIEQLLAAFGRPAQATEPTKDTEAT